MKNGHIVRQGKLDIIKCMCGKPAGFCEYAGHASWYWCAACWIIPGPSGTTPEHRAK